MAGSPLSFEDLDDLPLPLVGSDRLVVGRGNDLKRLDFNYWKGGPSDRRIVSRPQSSDFGTWVNQDGASVTDLDDGIAIEHDNSKTGDYSVDGVVWDYFFTQAISGPFVTAPDQWGFFINPVNNVTPHLPMRMDVFDWSE